MKNKFFWFLLFSAFLASEPVFALISPISIATDPRIKTVSYSPNEVIKFTGYYRYQSNIQFADDELIATISLGDSVAWQINPVGNRLFLKPIEQDATTNMTIITNKHTYFFELHADDAKDISDSKLIFELRIVYPGENNDQTVKNNIDHVPDLEQEDLNKYNFRYTISGSDEVAPIRIFDDGEFTYFQFHDINANIPAFFLVDKEGNESILNYRTRGSYIVVERVAPRYTLRHGNSIICVFNEAMVQGKKGNKSDSASKNSSSSSNNSSQYNSPSFKK